MKNMKNIEKEELVNKVMETITESNYNYEPSEIIKALFESDNDSVGFKNRKSNKHVLFPGSGDYLITKILK